MKKNFVAALDFTLKYEGGWSNHPSDPGGATMRGVTLATYRKFFPNATAADLKVITRPTLERIYHVGYWKPIDGDSLPSGIDVCAFDYAVNSGPVRAKRAIAAVSLKDPVAAVKRICASRLSFVRGLKTWKVFGRGWKTRIAAVEVFALKLAGANLRAELAESRKVEESAAKRVVTSSGGAIAVGGSSAFVPVDFTPILLGVMALLIVIGVVAAIHQASVQKARQKALIEEIAKG